MRLREDQIEVFKILNGYENINRNIVFSLRKDSGTRGHEVTLVKDSREANGFLVLSPSGPLPWMAILLNLVSSC